MAGLGRWHAGLSSGGAAAPGSGGYTAMLEARVDALQTKLAAAAHDAGAAQLAAARREERAVRERQRGLWRDAERRQLAAELAAARCSSAGSEHAHAARDSCWEWGAAAPPQLGSGYHDAAQHDSGAQPATAAARSPPRRPGSSHRRDSAAAAAATQQLQQLQQLQQAASVNEALASELLATKARAKALHVARSRLEVAAGEAGRLAAENAALRGLLQERAAAERRLPAAARRAPGAAARVLAPHEAAAEGWGFEATGCRGGVPAAGARWPCEPAEQQWVGDDGSSYSQQQGEGENGGAADGGMGQLEDLEAELAAAADRAVLGSSDEEGGVGSDDEGGSGSDGGDVEDCSGSEDRESEQEGEAEEGSERPLAPERYAVARTGGGFGQAADDGSGEAELGRQQQQLPPASEDSGEAQQQGSRPPWDTSPVPAVGAQQRSPARAAGGARKQQPHASPAAAARRAGLPPHSALSWVPADALACVRDFYIEQGLAGAVPWPRIEALLAQLDRAFRARSAAALEAQRAAFEEREAGVRRRADAGRSMPQVVAGERIATLKRQLAEARRALAARDAGRQKALLQVAERGQHISRELDKATTACADLAEQLHASEAARAAATRRVRGAFLAGARWQAGRLAGALGKAEAAVAEGAASLEGFTHRMAENLGLESLLLPELLPRQEAALSTAAGALAALHAHVDAIGAAARAARRGGASGTATPSELASSRSGPGSSSYNP